MNINSLRVELERLEGILYQNPETGKQGENSHLMNYTNRVFGAPFQLLPSVDMRFGEINNNLGTEYLRNIMLNSPILRIKPGMPKYTGNDDPNSLVSEARRFYGSNSKVEELLTSLAQKTLFNKGAKMQRRLFGFRETYYDYMQHVNYMCRSMAVFMNLTSGGRFPAGTFLSGNGGMQPFSNMNWENYRLLDNMTSLDPVQYLKELAGDTIIGAIIGNVGGSVSQVLHGIGGIFGGSGDASDIASGLKNMLTSPIDGILEGWSGTLINTFKDKVCTVDFMVEPVSPDETLTNTTKESQIESAIDSLRSGIGSELGFITNSHADTGILESMGNVMGTTMESAANALAGLVEPVTGGFMTGLFTGAVQSIKGQKMIYPKIYDSSNSDTNYSFKVHLSTPYGDPYNYYINIVVPLMHLIALAAPRMVTSNTVGAPFIVQAFIPGLCTIQMGIVSSLHISKNPDSNRISVNGYPLDVDVDITIEELYNAMSISPANDPASFLFNETLNDYMANLAGLIPSIDTYNAQRSVAFANLGTYLGQELVPDIAAAAVEKLEDMFNPFIAR